MARPLFEIARETAADWEKPSPQAKPYLKGMLYLLGVDDHVADLDAMTVLRFFLLYSKEWNLHSEEVKRQYLPGLEATIYRRKRGGKLSGIRPSVGSRVTILVINTGPIGGQG